MLRIIRKSGCILTAFALVAVLCTVVAASSGTQSYGVRRIAIVLDNSGSMIIEPNSSRWAQATYALRTFLYMVDDDDQVGLFTVFSDSNAEDSANEKAATVSIDLDKNNINKELEKVGISPTTATHGLKAAYKWVAEDPSAEKWVVILSDGIFYKNGPLSFEKSVVAPAQEAGGQGVHTIFIGLELDQKQKQEQEQVKGNIQFASFLTIHNTSPEHGIEETILEISNDIYQMKELNLTEDILQNSEEFNYDSRSGVLTWATNPGLSSYLSQVIIIAQTNNIPEDAQQDSLDPRIQIIPSDDSFSWASEENLQEVLDTYNSQVRSDLKLPKSKEEFQSKIEKTFLNKYCYVGSYSGEQLGEKLEFQTPSENCTYRIYYALRDDIVPELVVRQNGVSIEADLNNHFFITEGLTELDYRLKVGKVEISQELQVIKPEVCELHAEGISTDREVGQYDISYCDTGENSYPVDTSFRGKDWAWTVQVGVDLQKYSFRISEGQELNIDRSEGWLIIETQLPPHWLKDHLKDHLQIETEKGELQFDLQEYDFQNGESESLIRVPVNFGGAMDLTQPIMVKAMFTTDDTDFLTAEQYVTLTQDTPEIATVPLNRLSWLGIPLHPRILVAEISAKVGGKPVENVSISNVTVTGVGNLEGARLEYDDENKRIFLYADPVSAWKILSGNEMQGDAVLRGTFYRNGVIVDPALEHPVTVAWKGSLAQVIALWIIIFMILAFAVIGAFFAKSGLLLLQELSILVYGKLIGYVSKRCPKHEDYYLMWEHGKGYYEITRNYKKLPIFTLKLPLPDEKGFFEEINRGVVVLKGTKNGYEIKENSRKQLDSKGVAVDTTKLDLGRPITFTCGEKTCILRNTRKRKPWVDVVIWLVLCFLVLAIAVNLMTLL